MQARDLSGLDAYRNTLEGLGLAPEEITACVERQRVLLDAAQESTVDANVPRPSGKPGQ